jgi:hypothetical protein
MFRTARDTQGDNVVNDRGLFTRQAGLLLWQIVTVEYDKDAIFHHGIRCVP